MTRLITASLFLVISSFGSQNCLFGEERTPPKKESKNQITIFSWYRFYLNQRADDFFFKSPPPEFSLTIPTGQQASIAFERKIFGSFGLGVQYTYWKTNKEYWYYTEQLPPDDRVKGLVYRRWGYQHFDLFGAYNCKLYRRHSAIFSLGVSHARGWDEVVDAEKNDPSLGFPYFGASHVARNSYWGGVVQLKYDYSIMKGRCAIGINANARAYYQFQRPMYNAGLHASVNF
jgi:hypothetical protein